MREDQAEVHLKQQEEQAVVQRKAASAMVGTGGGHSGWVRRRTHARVGQGRALSPLTRAAHSC